MIFILEPGALKIWIQPAAHFTETNQQNVRKKQCFCQKPINFLKVSRVFNALKGVRNSGSLRVVWQYTDYENISL